MNRKSTVQLHLIPVLGSSLEKHAVASTFFPCLLNWEVVFPPLEHRADVLYSHQQYPVFKPELVSHQVTEMYHRPLVSPFPLQ